MFFKEFLINYLSSVFAGVTLGLLGLIVYNKYHFNQQKNDNRQENSQGDNLMQTIQNQNITVILPEGSNIEKTITTRSVE